MNSTSPEQCSKFFERGYLATKLEYLHYRKLLMIIRSLPWEPDLDGPYRYRWHRGDSPWHEDPYIREKILAKWTLQQAPQKLIHTVDECLKSENTGGNLVKNFRYTLQWIDAWEGVEDIGWHWDGPAQSPIIVLVYLTEREWDYRWGGQLQIGRRDPLPDNWQCDYSNVEMIDEIPPMPGTWVMLNNLAPQVVHRPVPITPDAANRYTLTFGFGPSFD